VERKVDLGSTCPGSRPVQAQGEALAGASACRTTDQLCPLFRLNRSWSAPPADEEDVMIIRRSVSIGARLLVGLFLGALVLGSMKARRSA